MLSVLVKFFLFKLMPWRKVGGRLVPPVIITGHPKAVLLLRFHLFYVWCCSVFKCFNFNTSVCPICLVQ